MVVRTLAWNSCCCLATTCSSRATASTDAPRASMTGAKVIDGTSLPLCLEPSRGMVGACSLLFGMTISPPPNLTSSGPLSPTNASPRGAEFVPVAKPGTPDKKFPMVVLALNPPPPNKDDKSPLPLVSKRASKPLLTSRSPKFLRAMPSVSAAVAPSKSPKLVYRRSLGQPH